MKLFRPIFAGAALALSTTLAHAQEAVLEHYVLGSGGTMAATSGNVSAFIQDAVFGGGDAEASVYLDTVEQGTLLHLRVWRHVPEGNISFALLVFGVEVRAFDAAGTQVFTRELGAFT